MIALHLNMGIIFLMVVLTIISFYLFIGKWKSVVKTIGSIVAFVALILLFGKSGNMMLYSPYSDLATQDLFWKQLMYDGDKVHGQIIWDTETTVYTIMNTLIFYLLLLAFFGLILFTIHDAKGKGVT